MSKFSRISTVLLMVVASHLASADFYFPDFSTVAGLQFNGDSGQAGVQALLVDANQLNEGSLWYTTRQGVTQGITTEFSVERRPGTGSLVYFSIQNLGTNFLPALTDPFPHSSVVAGVDTMIGAAYLGSVDSSGSFTQFGQGTYTPSLVDTFAVSYNPVGHSWDLSVNGGGLASGSYDPAQVISFTSGTDAYVGFGGSQTAGQETIYLNSWKYSVVPEPASFSCFAILAILSLKRYSK